MVLGCDPRPSDAPRRPTPSGKHARRFRDRRSSVVSRHERQANSNGPRPAAPSGQNRVSESDAPRSGGCSRSTVGCAQTRINALSGIRQVGLMGKLIETRSSRRSRSCPPRGALLPNCNAATARSSRSSLLRALKTDPERWRGGYRAESRLRRPRSIEVALPARDPEACRSWSWKAARLQHLESVRRQPADVDDFGVDGGTSRCK